MLGSFEECTVIGALSKNTLSCFQEDEEEGEEGEEGR